MTDVPGAPRASLALLRRITDRHVVDQLLATEAMTRAEVAAATGISKPTVSEAVRRLERDGVLVEAGAAPSGRRGPAGVHYRLRSDLGVALALEGGPDGLVAEVLDLRGSVLRRVERATPSPVRAVELAPLLVDLVQGATTDLPGPVRAGALSLAGPVDRTTGRLVHLPHSPFLVDELDARPLLEPLVGVGLAVDNDVNWAALAEHDVGVAAGLAGEPAHVLTRGPDGRATSLVGCFGELGLLRPGSDTIAVDAVVRALTGGGSEDVRRRDAVVEAVAGVLATIATLLNPAALVVGGPWAAAPGFNDRLAMRTRELLVAPTPLLVAGLGGAAPLLGARVAALRDLRAALFDEAS